MRVLLAIVHHSRTASMSLVVMRCCCSNRSSMATSIGGSIYSWEEHEPTIGGYQHRQDDEQDEANECAEALY